MERLDWNKVLDRYLKEKTMSVDDYEDLNEVQKLIINELKKSYKRNDKQL